MTAPDDDDRQAAPPASRAVASGDVLRRAVCWGVIIACVVALVYPAGESARRAAPPGTMLAICVLAFLLAAVGGPCLSHLAARARQGRLHPAYVPALAGDAPRIAYLEGFAFYLLGFILLSLLVSRWSHGSLEALGWCFAIAPVALLSIICRPGASWSDVRAGIGWHRGRGIVREMCAGLFGYLAGFPVLAAMFLITGALASVWGMPTHPLFEHTGVRSHVLTLYLLGCVGAPLVEETMFRGVLFHYLRRGHGRFVSALLSALLFAAIHPQGIVALPVLTGMALVFAGIREWRGSLIASMFAHALNNGAVISLALALAQSR